MDEVSVVQNEAVPLPCESEPSVDTQDNNPTSLPFPLPNPSSQGASKSKKRKGRTTASRGPTALPRGRGNGFEEYFADPPMTPDEANEEKNEIYASDLPFSQRMQNCIQRFRSRRRLQGERTLLFNDYLFLGGIDTNPAMFGGLSRQDLRDLTPAQRREATATDMIYGTSAAGDRFYDGDGDAWAVDFAGVAAGFFSTALVNLTSFEPALMEQGIDVVENFLRYVLHHEVCPEYKDDVDAALRVCDDARREWSMLRGLFASLPGQFNLAAADLFVADDAAGNWSFQQFSRPQGFDAKSIFYSAFALMEEPELFSRLFQATPKVVQEFCCTLELTHVFMPSDDVVSRFKSLVIGDGAAKMMPMGKAMFKRTVIEDDWVTPEVPWPIAEETLTLFFDSNLLSNMCPGMKARLVICELNMGLRFVKAVDAILPSFYTHLPQELMRHYKPPKESDRPAPSVHDPDAEEKQHSIAAKEG